jgi:hypothetical protein
MRPRYETTGDKARQRRTIGVFCEAFKCEAVPTPDLTGWDYEIHRDGKTVGLVEVKCRLCNHATYPTYMIGLRKMTDLRAEASRRAIPSILLVAWQDRIGFVHTDTAIDTGFVAHGGRNDRDDPMDTEAVLHIPIDKFRYV